MSPNNKPNNLKLHTSETIHLINLPLFFHSSKKLLLKQISCKKLRPMKVIFFFWSLDFNWVFLIDFFFFTSGYLPYIQQILFCDVHFIVDTSLFFIFKDVQRASKDWSRKGFSKCQKPQWTCRWARSFFFKFSRVSKSVSKEE